MVDVAEEVGGKEGEEKIGKKVGEWRECHEHRGCYLKLNDEVEDWKGRQTSMKGIAIKALISDGLSRQEREKTVGVKVFLAGGCKEEVLVIKDEVGSINTWRGNTGVTLGILCTNTWEGSKI